MKWEDDESRKGLVNGKKFQLVIFNLCKMIHFRTLASLKWEKKKQSKGHYIYDPFKYLYKTATGGFMLSMYVLFINSYTICFFFLLMKIMTVVTA